MGERSTRQGLRIAMSVAALAGALGAGVVLGGPAGACTLALPTLEAPEQVTVGGTARVTGAFWFALDPNPPSTTTTTSPDGGIIAECPATIPARGVHLRFVQGSMAVDLETAPVTLDQTFAAVIAIPATATEGPAQIVASTENGPDDIVADVVVVAAAPPSVTPSYTG